MRCSWPPSWRACRGCRSCRSVKLSSNACFAWRARRGDRESPAARDTRGDTMCRNVRTLFNFSPPATDEEVRAASLQFVRKISGFTKPSRLNQAAFDRAVTDVARAARTLLEALKTTAPPKDREVEAARARARAIQRFGGATFGGASADPSRPME